MTAAFSAEVHDMLDHRSGNRCEVCGAARVVEHHHRRARGAGSTKRPETGWASNGLACCGPCHRLIESHRNLATLLGWLVPQHMSPAGQPVLVRGEWVSLDNEGNYLREAA